jgi:hypothetical protein
MKPPRCPGRRKKPCHGFYSSFLLKKEAKKKDVIQHVAGLK